jgi:undecaprenyl-diphosphatase
MASVLPSAVRRRLNPIERYGLRLTLAVVAFVLVVVPFASLLFEVLAEGPLTRFDGNVADSLNHWVHDSALAVDVLEAVSWMGRPPILWLLVGSASAYAWYSGARKITIYLLATTISGGILSTLVKVLVDRPRPEVDHPIVTALGKSFPSGHALSSTVCYGAVLLAFLPVVHRRWRTPVVVGVIVLVLSIGLSRLFLGVHFVSDVLAGHILGVAWLAAATSVFEIWRVERGKRPTEPLHEGVEPEEAKRLSSA